MTDIVLETDSTVPANATVTVTVYQDTENDGSGANTDPNGKAYDNSASTTLAGGTGETNTLTGFAEDQDGAYWVEIDFSTTAATDDVAIVERVEIQTPAIPANLSASTVSGDQIDLSWDAAEDADSYAVYRATSSGSTLADYTQVTTGVTGTTFSDTGLSDGTEYFYRVTGENSTFESDGSNEASAITDLPAPTSVTVVDDQSNIFAGELEVTYTDESDSENGFRLQKSTDGGSTWSTIQTVGANVTSIVTTEDDFSINTTFDLRVQVHTDDATANSSSVQADTTITTFSGFWLRLVQGRDDSRAVTDLTAPDFVKEHSALSDWEARVPYDESLEDYRFAEAYLFADDTFLFRGFCFIVQSDEQSVTTTVSGLGVEHELERGSASVTYTDEFADVALQDYLDNHSNIGGSVTTPSVDTVSGIDVQDADTTSEWDTITPDPASDEPYEVAGGSVRLLQSCYFIEGEDADRGGSGTIISDDPDNWSGDNNGQVMEIESNLDSPEWDFTTEYDIPAGDTRVHTRLQMFDSGHPPFDVILDGTTIASYNRDVFVTGETEAEWLDDGDYGSELTAGSHTLNIDITGSVGSDEHFYIDCVAVEDHRESHTFSDSVSNGVIAGPELYPASVTVAFAAASTAYNVTSATLSTTWNDTSNNQAIGLSFDDGSTWADTSNTSSTTESTSEPTTTVKARATISRYTSDSSTSPGNGDATQELQVLDLDIDGDTRGVIDDETITGNHLENIQRLLKRAGMRFVLSHKIDNKSIEAFREGDVTGTLSFVDANKTRTVDVEGYANKITGFGAKKSDGTRYEVSREDSAEISALATDLGISESAATIPRTFTDPSIDNVIDLRAAVRSRLSRAVDEDQVRGTIEAWPVNADPGKSYSVSAWGGDTPLERVRYAFSEAGDPQGVLEFERSRGLGAAVSDVRADQSEVRDAI